MSVLGQVFLLTSHLVYIATSWCTEMLWDPIKCTQQKKAFTGSQFWMHTFSLIVIRNPWNAVSATRLLKVQQFCIIHHELVHRDDKSDKCPHCDSSYWDAKSHQNGQGVENSAKSWKCNNLIQIEKAYPCSTPCQRTHMHQMQQIVQQVQNFAGRKTLRKHAIYMLLNTWVYNLLGIDAAVLC